jgi:hypothetical protein
MPTPFQLRLAERMPVEIFQGQNLCRNFSCNKHKNKRTKCETYWRSIYKKQSVRSSRSMGESEKKIKGFIFVFGKETQARHFSPTKGVRLVKKPIKLLYYVAVTKEKAIF